jgi:hypothetical protein
MGGVATGALSTDVIYYQTRFSGFVEDSKHSSMDAIERGASFY